MAAKSAGWSYRAPLGPLHAADVRSDGRGVLCASDVVSAVSGPWHRVPGTSRRRDSLELVRLPGRLVGRVPAVPVTSPGSLQAAGNGSFRRRSARGSFASAKRVPSVASQLAGHRTRDTGQGKGRGGEKVWTAERGNRSPRQFSACAGFGGGGSLAAARGLASPGQMPPAGDRGTPISAPTSAGRWHTSPDASERLMNDLPR